MEIPKIMTAFALSADGFDTIGKGQNLKLPGLQVLTEDIRTGGLNAALKQDVGQEGMELQFALKEYDPRIIRLWGAMAVDAHSFEARGHCENALREEMALIATMRGRLDFVDPAEAQAAQSNDIAFTASIVYYRLQIDGIIAVEIDILGGKRYVNGEDVLAGMRTSLGL